MINKCYFQSPIGVLILEADGEGICRLEICRDSIESESAKESGRKAVSACIMGECAAVWKSEETETAKKAQRSADMNPLLLQAGAELTEYFAGKRREFTVPVSMKGTDFQMQVWQKLREIPYGETYSYGQLAEAIGNPRAARAVGMANNRNPVMILVPCHRVIGKDGRLVGFGGGLEAKKYLLELEHGI